MTPRPILERALALAVAAAVLAATFGATGGASAQTVEEKRAEAARIAQRLDELEKEYSRVEEEYHQAADALEEADQAVSEAEARVQQTRAQLEVRQEEVQAYAVEAYVGGDAVPGLDLLLGSEPDEVPKRRTYLSSASGDRQDLIDKLRAAQDDLDTEIDALEASKSESERIRDEAAAKREQAQGTIAELEALEARVEGELAELVRQEEARRAAAEARRAEERARQVAAEADEAPPPAVTRTPTTAGSGAATPTSAAPAPEPAPAPAPGGGGGAPPGGASTAVSVAWSLIGVPYVWGGSSPSGFDCSGFTSYVWNQAGRSIPRTSAAQYAYTRRISLSELQPGDLVFYGRPSVHHVALYVGGGTIVHAPGAGRSVRADSVYYWDALVGAGRLP